jgi:hypothetical protein
MNQLFMAVFGLAAMHFSMGTDPVLRMWAPIIGLAGQPFWAYFAWKTKAWGLAVLVVAYSAVYANGVLVLWGVK